MPRGMVALTLLATLVLVAPLPALADWRHPTWGASWGSSPDEVRAALGDQVVDNPGLPNGPSPDEAPLAAPYRAAGFEFTAFFSFESSEFAVRMPFGLWAVSLVPDDAQNCPAIVYSLVKTYGALEAGENAWKDPATEAQVVFGGDLKECTVIYRDLQTLDAALSGRASAGPFRMRRGAPSSSSAHTPP